MKKLVCEVCGGELIKEGEFLVCQNCGCKYSLDAAKKMMVEGKVDVSGSTVKVDNSDELDNLYQLARRARDNSDMKNAQKYYEQVLVKDPSSWEASFYPVYCECYYFTDDNVESHCKKIGNCAESILQLVKTNVTDVTERKKVVEEIFHNVMQLSNTYYNTFIKWHNIPDGYYDSTLRDIALEKRINANIEMLDRFSSCYLQIFGEEYINEIVVPYWKDIIRQYSQNITISYGNKQAGYKNNVLKFEGYIKKYEPSYQAPYVVGPKNSACYVATAVYGSYDCPEVWTLRRYRDFELAKTFHGRAFIRMYYAISPTLVKWFGDTKWFKRMWKGKLDRMVKNLQDRGYESTPYEDQNW